MSLVLQLPPASTRLQYLTARNDGNKILFTSLTSIFYGTQAMCYNNHSPSCDKVFHVDNTKTKLRWPLVILLIASCTSLSDSESKALVAYDTTFYNQGQKCTKVPHQESISWGPLRELVLLLSFVAVLPPNNTIMRSSRKSSATFHLQKLLHHALQAQSHNLWHITSANAKIRNIITTIGKGRNKSMSICLLGCTHNILKGCIWHSIANVFQNT